MEAVICKIKLANIKFSKVLRNYIWHSVLFKTVATQKTVTSMTVNSVIDIFLQVFKKFRNTAVFKIIFSMSKSGLMLS